MNGGAHEHLVCELYCVRVALDEYTLTVTATNAAGRGALGAAAVRIPLAGVFKVAMKPSSMLANGQVTVESQSGITLLHFRRKSTNDASALVDALNQRCPRIAAPPAGFFTPVPASRAAPSEPSSAEVVQVQYFPSSGTLVDTDGKLPDWTTELSPSSDRRGYCYVWRPAVPPKIGSIGVDDMGRKIAVVGFGRKGYDGPLRQVTAHLPGTVFDEIVASGVLQPASQPTFGHVSPPNLMAQETAPDRRAKNTQPNHDAPIELTDEFKSALGILASRSSMFLTGKAGTGKSTLIRHFMANTDKRVVVAAPTGIAALNVDGLTIHRLFGFTPSTTLDDVAFGQYSPGRRFAKVIGGMDTLIIDEASMVRADLLDQVEIALRRFGPHRGHPFGGVQVILVGDLFQLPPVVPKSEKVWLDSRYDTPYFYSAASFTRERFRIVSLSRVFRQLGDDHLTGLLNAVREGVLVDQARDALNTRVNPDFSPPDDEFWLTVAPTNRIVHARNVQALQQLPGETYHHDAVTSGDISGFDSPVEHEITYKAGAQIMLLNNDPADRWVNGTIGRVTRVSEGGSAVDVLLNDGRLVEVRPHTWEVTEPRYSEGMMTRVAVGTFTQLPFKLAWAVTIHKCQGLTLDKLIVDLTGGTFDYGQTYVALSRCTSTDGLVLRKPLLASHLKTDRRVVRFLAEAASAEPHGRHVALAALTVGADDARSKPRPVEIAFAFDDGAAVSTLVNPERDLTGARERYGISANDIALAPTLSEAWATLARIASGTTPVGVDVDQTVGYLDWELKRLGVVRPLPLGIAVDPDEATPFERAELSAGSALRRARAALSIFQRNGGTGGAPFGAPNADDAITYLLPRDAWTAPPVGSALGAVLSASQLIGAAVIRGEVIAAKHMQGNEMVRQVVAARLASVAQKSAGLSPTLIDRLQPLGPLLGADVVGGLIDSRRVAPSAVVFVGARVCFTGDATDSEGNSMTRSQIEAYAQSVGLVPVSSVTKTRCDLLVVAELGTQSGKARKAAEYGKPVITVEQFLSTKPSPAPAASPPVPNSADPPPELVPARSRGTDSYGGRAGSAYPSIAGRIEEATAALEMQRGGSSQADIAVRLGRSADAVKSLLSDARFFQSPQQYPERESLARQAAHLRASTGATQQQIVLRLGLGKKAADRVFRDAQILQLRETQQGAVTGPKPLNL
ncbi:MAG: AAA family ATPase [Bifidobacteriaceae bacterium]|jgi:hypothetical protein|nr:AAA family ATPase [Bifidobacteriaceae bacterium]